jgi:hypothetical protein
MCLQFQGSDEPQSWDVTFAVVTVPWGSHRARSCAEVALGCEREIPSGISRH